MVHSSFFKEIYLQSLTPFEVLKTSKQKDYRVNKKSQVFYLDYWKKNIHKDGSDEIFKKYCEVNNLSSKDISLMTSTITNVNGAIDFPVWVYTLEEILNTINLENIPTNDKVQKEPFYQLFFPFIDFFSSKLKQNLRTLNISIPIDQVIDQLNLALQKDLFDTAHLVLLHEFSEYKNENDNSIDRADDFFFKKFVFKILSDKFQDLFLSYPMLAKKLATKTNRYLKFITGIFEKLKADKSEIEYFFNTKLDELSQLYLNSGDQHNGESTVILEFKNSYKIVYKPTNVAVTFAYNQFLDWVNKELGEELKSFKVIDKSTYGWLEYVDHFECKTIDDIELYYERAGILVGIAYFLNARDYHFENVIASGNCPVLIDHETTIVPTIKIFNPEANINYSKESVVGTILESLLLPVQNQGIPIYACGLGSSKQLEHSLTIQKIEDCNKDTMRKVLKTECRNLYNSNKPKLDSKIENLIDYQPEFKKGFDKIYTLVLENKEKLLSENSPLLHFRDLKIRFINRITGVYFKILKLLNKPEYLRDATKYGLKLELLARAYAVIGNWSPILGYERKQMLMGDIPVFYTNTVLDHLVLENEDTADVFEISALESVHRKIRKATLKDYSDQMNLIEEVIKL